MGIKSCSEKQGSIPKMLLLFLLVNFVKDNRICIAYFFECDSGNIIDFVIGRRKKIIQNVYPIWDYFMIPFHRRAGKTRDLQLDNNDVRPPTNEEIEIDKSKV